MPDTTGEKSKMYILYVQNAKYTYIYYIFCAKN